ncbi:unnamed protein product [Phytophthora lilii]|uniref:Unnamed protein product n=1 Tax=Phytophthora lilii TaxID=2077276 RepID=A0A9W6TH58_9STRA|nr:unnamed protein product [Phytophthora lilii]
MSCCPVNMEPARATAPASRAIRTYGSTKLFVSGPAKAKAGVLSLPDIFGIDSGRIQQDAEALGKLGYAVVVVDAASGDYKTPKTRVTCPGEDAPAHSVPQLLLSAGNDPEFVREGGSLEKILKAKADIGAQCEVVDFPDVIHGWVNRSDLENPVNKAAVMKAWHAAVKFTQTVNPL